MATAMRAPRSPEKAIALLLLFLLMFTGLLVTLSLYSVSDLHLHHGHLEHHSAPVPSTHTHEHEHTHTHEHGDSRYHHVPRGTSETDDHSVGTQIAGSMAVEEDEGHHHNGGHGGDDHHHHGSRQQQQQHGEDKHDHEEKKDRRHEGGDDGDPGDGEGHEYNNDDQQHRAIEPDQGDADGHGHHGFLRLNHHNDEIRSDPVGDWVHHRWEDTKHLAHDVYEAADHLIESAEDMTGVHVFHHDHHDGEEEGEGMSGGMTESPEEADHHHRHSDDHEKGNARALMASKTIAELVTEAGSNRKKAQAAVLAKLNGKVHVTKDKEPVPSYNYTSPPSAVPKQCKEGTKISKSSVVNQKYIFHNSGGYSYSHMVMIGAMPPTSLWRWAMTWQASSSIEGAPGQHLLISFSDEPEKEWTKPMVIPIQPMNLAVWGPVWHLDDEGVIHLFFAQSTSCRKNAGRGRIKFAPGGDIKYIKSVDGVTWTAPKMIITQASDQGIPKLVANQLQVHSETGHWVLPYWREQPHSKQCKPHADRSVRTSAGVLLSKDKGKTWKAIGSWRARGIRWLIEGTVAEVGDKGRLLQLYRSGEPTLYKQTSDDGGTNWSPAMKTSIPNPNSKVNLIRMTNGDIALAFNDARGGVRRKLSVAVSPDGSAWTRLQQLEDTTSGLHYAYPTMTQDGCRLLVAYSVMRHGGRRRISESGIKLAVITVPTKKPPKTKSVGGDDAAAEAGGEGGSSKVGGEEAEEPAGGEDAGISLDAPQGADDETDAESAEGAEAEGEEEKPIREGDEEEEGEGGVITKADEAAELAGGA